MLSLQICMTSSFKIINFNAVQKKLPTLTVVHALLVVPKNGWAYPPLVLLLCKQDYALEKNLFYSDLEYFILIFFHVL